MSITTLTRYPCVILSDDTPSDQCRAMETLTEAMLNTPSLRIRRCETQLDANGYYYTDVTITGPSDGVYEPGKLITVVTPHTERTGRIKSWAPTHRIYEENGEPKYYVEFTMIVKFMEK